MNNELTFLTWTLVLALVQVIAHGVARTKETGAKFNVSARDTTPPPYGIIAGRLYRAQTNLFETLPLFAAAVLIAHVAGRESALTAWGALLYFWGRLIYVPLYVMGIPVARTLVWMAATIGLILIFVAILI
ncbi:MAPEG family protein [Beijerinckia indica]|uniref:Inner membrane protein n=1 Tax=Beijerinckia indica subsp. indica (strain ATCC 9039 / DSM 1715 / NCIMB 8712) TaxID=395963 RepID=B2IEW3_BEII9|nr:MAPEG family protein [Beijerinckia indica]ACB94154.1 inner membrane protein [Beijerinckia indica subsp. indica ATCC 9039]